MKIDISENINSCLKDIEIIINLLNFVSKHIKETKINSLVLAVAEEEEKEDYFDEIWEDLDNHSATLYMLHEKLREMLKDQ